MCMYSAKKSGTLEVITMETFNWSLVPKIKGFRSNNCVIPQGVDTVI